MMKTYERSLIEKFLKSGGRVEVVKASERHVKTWKGLGKPIKPKKKEAA
jgi:hypothetical protein